jgi:hypothetical protein
MVRSLEPTFHTSGRPARSAAPKSPPATTEPQAETGDKEPSSKMYAKKKVPPKKKASAPAKSTTPRGGSAPIWEGAPDEKLESGWPMGWIKRVYERKGGATKGQTDRYWYSPISAFKLRSMAEVKRFIAALAATNGDEQKAKKTMKNY